MTSDLRCMDAKVIAEIRARSIVSSQHVCNRNSCTKRMKSCIPTIKLYLLVTYKMSLPLIVSDPISVFDGDILLKTI